MSAGHCMLLIVKKNKSADHIKIKGTPIEYLSIFLSLKIARVVKAVIQPVTIATSAGARARPLLL